jgi:hypothetical protein
MRHLDRTGNRFGVLMVTGVVCGFDLELDVAVFDFSTSIEREHQEVDSVIVFDSLARRTALENEPFDMIHAQVRDHVLARAAFLPPHGILSRSRLRSTYLADLPSLSKFRS